MNFEALPDNFAWFWDINKCHPLPSWRVPPHHYDFAKQVPKFETTFVSALLYFRYHTTTTHTFITIPTAYGLHEEQRRPFLAFSYFFNFLRCIFSIYRSCAFWRVAREQSISAAFGLRDFFMVFPLLSRSFKGIDLGWKAIYFYRTELEYAFRALGWAQLAVVWLKSESLRLWDSGYYMPADISSIWGNLVLRRGGLFAEP